MERPRLRLQKEQNTKKESLSNALIEGEDSGIVEKFNSEQFLKDLHTKHGV
jgi:Arc/MetJ-type ribon-helix-helix transcriptional regulator